MIRLSLAVKEIAGLQGLTASTLAIHIRQVDIERTAEELFDNKYFGFSRSNVFMIPAKEESGFSWDTADNMFTLVRHVGPSIVTDRGRGTLFGYPETPRFRFVRQCRRGRRACLCLCDCLLCRTRRARVRLEATVTPCSSFWSRMRRS